LLNFSKLLGFSAFFFEKGAPVPTSLKEPRQLREGKRAKTASTRSAAPQSSEKRYRISGHESFACRFAWLPKVVRLASQDPSKLLDDDASMVEMGLGKNMVRSAKFWAQVSGMIRINRGEPSVTELGKLVLGEKGLDPYLEDIQTLWLLHWHLSTDLDNPLLAWHFLLSQWNEPEIPPSTAIKALLREVEKHDAELSIATIDQHFSVFVHTYVPTRGKKEKIQEDNLDCPLVELEFLQKIGERESSSGDREPIYSFRRGEKNEISPGLFTYCLLDFWNKRHKSEATLTFKDIAHGYGSPGQVFKLMEEDIRVRLEALTEFTSGACTYMESTQIPRVHKEKDFSLKELLHMVYKRNGNAA
jgi:hypothetical protein